MKYFLVLISCHALFALHVAGQRKAGMLDKNDLAFLAGITKAVLDSSKIYQGDSISPLSGRNNTGGTLIRPGGRDDYPSFWIRDYAMSLETGLITEQEQLHMLQLTAATQCDKAWTTKQGGHIPVGAIADHIRIGNSLPIYFPGTYSYEEQGDKFWGTVPPFCDQFYFIHMAYYYTKTTGSHNILSAAINGKKLIDRLEMAFVTPPARAGNQLVYTTKNTRGVDFGFRDAIQITGDLCLPSILKYQAATQLATLFGLLQNKSKAAHYRQIAAQIKSALPVSFSSTGGLLRASTGWSNQPDVWATALAVYFNILEGQTRTKACRALANAYRKGTLAFKGNIRHVLTSDDYSEKTAWEKTEVEKNRYQNGAYWGTPTGWVCYAIYQADPQAARKLAREYIDDLRENDCRKGNGLGAPYECFYPPAYKQNPLYLATVACPYIVFKKSF